jgi:hypothetical protein
VLESWHYVGSDKHVRFMRENKAQIFLDSGAFSAYTLGVKLSVEEYCNYIKKNIDIIRKEDGVIMASVLDGIGDVVETYNNQLQMEKLGVRPLPCFHAGEDERYLEWYVANYDYITLGGMVGANTAQLQIWLDRVWGKYLLDGAGNPKIKVHGFGITSVPLMERYPWQSCDSSSWVQAAAFGVIMDAKYGNIQISAKSPSRHDAGQHLTTFTAVERAAVEARITSKGFDHERLANVGQSRFAYNIDSYVDTNAALDAKKRSDSYSIPLVQELF